MATFTVWIFFSILLSILLQTKSRTADAIQQVSCTPVICLIWIQCNMESKTNTSLWFVVVYCLTEHITACSRNAGRVILFRKICRACQWYSDRQEEQMLKLSIPAILTIRFQPSPSHNQLLLKIGPLNTILQQKNCISSRFLLILCSWMKVKVIQTGSTCRLKWCLSSYQVPMKSVH